VALIPLEICLAALLISLSLNYLQTGLPPFRGLVQVINPGSAKQFREVISYHSVNYGVKYTFRWLKNGVDAGVKHSPTIQQLILKIMMLLFFWVSTRVENARMGKMEVSDTIVLHPNHSSPFNHQ